VRRIAALLLLTALGACATAPSRPPAVSDVVLPEAFVYQDAAARGTLAALLPAADSYAQLRALADNAPDLAAAVARIDAARAQLRGAGAARLPNVSASGGVTQQRGAAASQPQNPFFDADQSVFQAGIDARWDADLFGRLRASERAAAARLDASTADAAAVRLALDTDIAIAFTDYHDAALREVIVKRDIADARELLRLTSIRARAGIVPGFDAVRADALLKDAEARLPPLSAARGDAVGRLVTLTATPAATILGLLGDATPSGAATVPEALPSSLLRGRPDIRAAEARLRAADQGVAAAAAARFPSLSITGALGLLALAAGDILTGDAITASLGAGVAGPLLDFGRSGAELARTEAAGREAFALYRGTVFRALGEAEAGLIGLRAARERANALTAQERVDTDALGLARERYRLGLSDFLTVVDAQRNLNITRQSAEAARSDIARRAALLYRALGGVTAPRP
jgi:NodT family efflux transporter outer membrane factor (OMF) lipoprotein